VNRSKGIYDSFLVDYVLTPFYQKRLDRIESLTLDTVLRSKNPYLFRAKNLEVAGDLVKSIVDAYLSSQEETIFGNLLEGFAIYISSILYGGFKREPALKSVDLEFKRDGIYYLVGIKSGTVWGNADQIKAMKDNFKEAKRKLREDEGVSNEIIAINGCMYGTEPNPLKDTKGRGKKLTAEEPDKVYFKYAGQDFWQFISGDENLYQEIIIPIGNEAKGRGEEFKSIYTSKINEMTEGFIGRFLTPDHQIDWAKLIDFVSKRRSTE